MLKCILVFMEPTPPLHNADHGGAFCFIIFAFFMHLEIKKNC